MLFLLKGILTDSRTLDSTDHVYVLVESTTDSSKNVTNNGNNEDLMVGEDEGDGSVASVEDQLRKEMTVYEVRNLNAATFKCQFHLKWSLLRTFLFWSLFQ